MRVSREPIETRRRRLGRGATARLTIDKQKQMFVGLEFVMACTSARGG